MATLPFSMRPLNGPAGAASSIEAWLLWQATGSEAICISPGVMQGWRETVEKERTGEEETSKATVGSEL